MKSYALTFQQSYISNYLVLFGIVCLYKLQNNHETRPFFNRLNLNHYLPYSEEYSKHFRTCDRDRDHIVTVTTLILTHRQTLIEIFSNQVNIPLSVLSFLQSILIISFTQSDQTFTPQYSHIIEIFGNQVNIPLRVLSFIQSILTFLSQTVRSKFHTTIFPPYGRFCTYICNIL